MQHELDVFNESFHDCTGLMPSDTASFGLHLDTESRQGWIIATLTDGWEGQQVTVATATMPYPNERMDLEFDYLLWETLGRLCGESYNANEDSR